MSKVITFSRVFPSYHPRKGEPTYFVEQFQNSLCSMNLPLYSQEVDPPLDFLNSLTKLNVGYKHHTIRAGHRWKVGDKFSPRVWIGKPYNSKQITIAPDIEIKKVWNIGMRIRGDFKELYCNDADLTGTSIASLASNDGLTVEDLLSWFNKPFTGQIISWNENISY